MSRRAQAGLAAAALVAALAWLAIGTRATLPEDAATRGNWSGDFLSYYLPNAEYLGARLAGGALPLWSPHHAGGAPFLATAQVGALYPPNALHGLVPTQTAFVVLTVLHLALAFTLAGLLAGQLGADGGGRILAGLAYAGSLQVAGGLWSPPVLYTAAWTPGLFLAVERLAARPSAGAATGLAVVLALSLLAGWPYNVVIGALGAGLYGTVRLLASAWRTRSLPGRTLLWLAFGVAAGVALAAPQLLPTAELLERSVRAPGSLVERQAVFVAAPHDPALLLRTLLARGFADGIPGALALLLAPLALVWPGPGRRRFAVLAAVGALALLVSFPNHLPVYGWLRELPVLGDFRFPYRYRLLTTLALAVGAGLGATRLTTACAARPRVALALATALGSAWVATAFVPAMRALRPFPRAVPAARPLEARVEALGLSLAPGARVYWSGESHKLRAPGARGVVHDMEPLTIAEVARMLTFFQTGRPSTAATDDRARLSEHPSGDYLAAPFYGRLALPPTGRHAAVLDVFAVGGIVADEPAPWLRSRYRQVSEPDSRPAAYQNSRAIPRATRLQAALPDGGTLETGLARLVRPDFDPKHMVLLDEVPAALRLRPGSVIPPAEGKVRLESRSPEHLVLTTRGRRPGLVVLSDIAYPGWEATLDGQPVPILRANVLFRGVSVPAGEHVVEMRYRPASLRRGMALAGVSGLLCVAALVRERRRQIEAPEEGSGQARDDVSP